ncbi:MAG: endonuclease III [Syntrophobacteraceae bacterium]|jgi:endonuclease-3
MNGQTTAARAHRLEDDRKQMSAKMEEIEKEALRERTATVLQRLTEAYGADSWNWHTQQTPFQILIGVVLSQRTKDENTDKAAKALFAKLPTPQAIAAASVEEIEPLIAPSMYFHTKALRIKEISEILLERHGGETPDSIEELLKLPGVGLKTASCVMVYGFGKPAIPVDAHVHRISNRLGIIQTKTPDESEKALWEVTPADGVMHINMLMVKHGQSTCRPVSPKCGQCNVTDLCDYFRALPSSGDGKESRSR